MGSPTESVRYCFWQSVGWVSLGLLLGFIVIVRIGRREEMGNNSAEQTGEFSEHSKCNGVQWSGIEGGVGQLCDNLGGAANSECSCW